MTPRAALFTRLLAEEATKIATDNDPETVALLADLREATFANQPIIQALGMYVISTHGTSPHEAILIGVQLGALAGRREPMESIAFELEGGKPDHAL